jgi:hypothetical protein
MTTILTPTTSTGNLTLLQIIQSVCRRIGITSPGSVVTNPDIQIQQLLELSNEEGQEQADRYQWQVLQVQAIFTTVAAQVQTTMAAIAPGWNYIVNDTIWNRTLRRPVYGPRSQQDWQQQQAMQINGPFNSFRIISDSINFYPIPPAGQLCAFEYITSRWVLTTTLTGSNIWTNDGDSPVIDDQLLILGTIWRWKQAKGFNYAEDFAKYERRMADLMGRDGGKPTLDLNGGYDSIRPGVFVPAGNWGA